MITVTLTFTDVESAATALAALGSTATTLTTVGAATDETPTRATRRTRTKETVEVDLGYTDDETEQELTGDTQTTYTQKDIIMAFKDYATDNTREKAIQVLKKFGVKSVKDLKETDYDKVMKALS